MKYDHFSMLPERAFQPRNGRTGMTLEGGSGGGGGPTTSTVTQTNLPDWLRPQTEALLGAGTQEYFQTQRNPETGGYDITGVKPYTPYSTDPRDYVAPFAPGQQQVFREAAGMQRPEGFAGGTQLAAMGGRGGIESAGAAYGYGGMGSDYGGMGASMAPVAQQMGQQGVGIGRMGLMAQPLGSDIGQEARFYGRQAAGMGGTYEQMATDPYAMSAYMSPYMRNVSEVAKQQAIEDAQRTQLGVNLGAARQGTYGGARQALMQSQREAALGKQLSDIETQGLQQAFDQAQKAQQFGITTGLQGLQGAQTGLSTAIQGGQLGLSGIDRALAGQQAGLQGLGEARALYGLGIQGAQMGLQGVQGAQAGYGMGIQGGQAVSNIASQQQEADLNRMKFQAEQAAIQQAQQQRIIDQAVQDYALGQEMPFQRLAGYSGLLRGYSTPTTTTSQYQAGANPASQLAGLGALAYGASKKKGGVINEGIDALAMRKVKRRAKK
jgi:hypothetical protein